jgi:hypothetical protein
MGLSSSLVFLANSVNHHPCGFTHGILTWSRYKTHKDVFDDEIIKRQEKERARLHSQPASQPDQGSLAKPPRSVPEARAALVKRKRDPNDSSRDVQDTDRSVGPSASTDRQIKTLTGPRRPYTQVEPDSSRKRARREEEEEPEPEREYRSRTSMPPPSRGISKGKTTPDIDVAPVDYTRKGSI